MMKHSHFPCTSTYSSTPHNTNRKHNIHHIPNPNTQHTSTHSKAKHNIFNNGRYTANIPTDPHMVTTTDIKINMRHIHTSIVSKHLATRGNGETLRTQPSHISSSEEILPCITQRTLAQLKQTNLPSSNRTDIKSTTKHIHHHYAISVTSTHTTNAISTTAPTYALRSHHWIGGQTLLKWWSCWSDGGISWLVDHKRDHRNPPLTRVNRVGRQQQRISRVNRVGRQQQRRSRDKLHLGMVGSNEESAKGYESPWLTWHWLN